MQVIIHILVPRVLSYSRRVGEDPGNEDVLYSESNLE